MKRLILGLAVLSLVILGTNYTTTHAKELSVQAFSQKGTLPLNGVRVPMLQLNLTAGNEAVTIKSVTLNRTGLSTSDDVGSVWIQNGYSRLTRSRQFNNDDELTLDFTRDLIIPANGKITLTVLANLEFEGGGRTLAINLQSFNTDAVLAEAQTQSQANSTTTKTVNNQPTQRTTRRSTYDRSLYKVQCRNSRCQLVKR